MNGGYLAIQEIRIPFEVAQLMDYKCLQYKYLIKCKIENETEYFAENNENRTITFNAIKKSNTLILNLSIYDNTHLNLYLKLKMRLLIDTMR